MSQQQLVDNWFVPSEGRREAIDICPFQIT